MKKTLLIIFLIITILNCDPDKLNPYGIDENEEENFRNIVLFLALRPSLTYKKTQLIFIKNINTSYTPILRNASIAGGSFMISPNISNTLSFQYLHRNYFRSTYIVPNQIRLYCGFYKSRNSGSK